MKDLDGVADGEEEEEEVNQGLAPRAHHEKSTEFVRISNCCWAHWSLTVDAAAADEAAAAAAAAAAACHCVFDGSWALVDAS